MPMYEHKCEDCNNISEALIKMDKRFETRVCPLCKGKAHLIISAPMLKLPFNDPAGFPTSYDKWAKKRRQKITWERKHES